MQRTRGGTCTCESRPPAASSPSRCPPGLRPLAQPRSALPCQHWRPAPWQPLPSRRLTLGTGTAAGAGRLPAAKTARRTAWKRWWPSWWGLPRMVPRRPLFSACGRLVCHPVLLPRALGQPWSLGLCVKLNGRSYKFAGSVASTLTRLSTPCQPPALAHGIQQSWHSCLSCAGRLTGGPAGMRERAGCAGRPPLCGSRPACLDGLARILRRPADRARPARARRGGRRRRAGRRRAPGGAQAQHTLRVIRMHLGWSASVAYHVHGGNAAEQDQLFDMIKQLNTVFVG